MAFNQSFPVYNPNDPLGLNKLKNLNVAGGQSTMVNGQPVQVQPNGFGTSTVVPYANPGGAFGSNPNLVGYTPPGGDSGFGWNLGTAGLLTSAVGGIGSLLQGWNGLKMLGIAKKQLAQNDEQFNQNFGMQKQAYADNVTQANNTINARKNFIQQTHANPDSSYLKTLSVA